MQLLGRADNVKEFIKRGEETATVEVTLSSGNPSRPIVVYRKMKMDKDSGGLSEWKLNGKLNTTAAIAYAEPLANHSSKFGMSFCCKTGVSLTDHGLLQHLLMVRRCHMHNEDGEGENEGT